MIFSNRRVVPDFPFVFYSNDINCPADVNLIFPLERISNGSPLPAIKMLGVYLDEFLTFDFHCSTICKKINSALFHLNSVKNLLSTESLTKLYYALIHPHILYCLPAYSFTSAKNRKMILNKQKQCVRLITKSKYNSHSDPLFIKTKILPLEDLIIQQKLLLMHSLAHNYSVVKYPQFIPNSEINEHRFTFRNSNDFFVPRSILSTVQKMPIIDFILTWNILTSL